jgi:succinate dehydrogenase/fumarate reductase flavoprotein subunit
MGGNALTETLVFGKIAGEAAARYSFDYISKSIKGLEKEKFAENCLGFEKGKYFPSKILKMIQNIMWNCCGPVRNEGELYLAYEEIERLKQDGICCDKPENLAYSFSVRNSIECAEIIVKSAIGRQESLVHTSE